MACPCGRTDRHVVMCSESEFIHYSLRPLFACGNAVSVAPEVQLAEVRDKEIARAAQSPSRQESPKPSIYSSSYDRKPMKKTFNNFHAHTSVVIRTFPEPRLVIIGVHRAVGTHAPMPFSVLVVYQMLLDETPASESPSAWPLRHQKCW